MALAVASKLAPVPPVESPDRFAGGVFLWPEGLGVAQVILGFSMFTVGAQGGATPCL
jgi:hypothetical protein